MTDTEGLFQISDIVNGGASFPQAVERIGLLLSSFDAPYRSLYSGKVLAPERLADFVNQQLKMLLVRTRLAERRAELKRELASIEQDLAMRKVMQRAEGLLVARRGMALAVAQRWIAQQSQRTGLSKEDVSDRIIAYYQATALQEQRIA